MIPELQCAIDTVYAAFSSVPKPKTIDGCRCCIEDKQVYTLLTKPLREITAAELSPYAASIFLTVGSEADYRYYLPRIAEILVTESGWWPDPEVAGHALTLAEWSKWPAPEREAIVHLFGTFFDALVADSDGFRLNSWLCGLARAEIPLQPFLDKLAAHPSATLALYKSNANELMERRLGNPFWDDAPQTAMKQIVDWFYSTDISLLILENYGVDLNLLRFQP
jgi:hypothetical protein